jgi:hypothetical protein
MAAGDETWFAQRLSVTDTGMESLADQERRDGMDEELVQQEYYCSFSGVQEGALFARQMNDAEVEGRICPLPAIKDRPVSTWWDLGMRDPMAIWFTQDVGPWVHVIDYTRIREGDCRVQQPHCRPAPTSTLSGWQP